MNTYPATRLESLLRKYEAMTENDGFNTARANALLDAIIHESSLTPEQRMARPVF